MSIYQHKRKPLESENGNAGKEKHSNLRMPFMGLSTNVTKQKKKHQ